MHEREGKERRERYHGNMDMHERERRGEYGHIHERERENVSSWYGHSFTREREEREKMRCVNNMDICMKKRVEKRLLEVCIMDIHHA